MGEGLIVRRGGGMGAYELADSVTQAYTQQGMSIAVPETGSFLCVIFCGNFGNATIVVRGGIVLIRNGKIEKIETKTTSFNTGGNYHADELADVEMTATLANGVLTVAYTDAYHPTGQLSAMLYRLDGTATSGAPEEITFTVAGTQYTAPEGMTWAEFVASDYNKKDEYGNPMFNIYSGNVYYIFMYGNADAENGEPSYSWIRESEEGIYQTSDMSILPGAEYQTDD